MGQSSSKSLGALPTNPTKLKGRAVLFFASVTVVRFFLAIHHNIYAITDAKYDELLFLTQSIEILKGNWLGDYGFITLVKLPVYSIWLAFVQVVHLDLVTAQHCLYILSVVLLLIAVCPTGRDYKLLLVLYSLCLFNPAYLSSQILDRVLRCGIYVSLTIMVFSSYIGMITYRSRRYVPIFWSLLGGISLAMLWLSREESMWIVPFIGLSSIIIMLINYDGKKMRGFGLIALPIIMVIIATISLMQINKKYYERPITVEIRDNDFENFYGALRSTAHPHKNKIIPVPREARRKLYEVSPTFSKVRLHLEGDILDYWHGIFDAICREYKSDQDFKKRFDHFYGYTINPFFQEFGGGDGAVCREKDYYGGWFYWGLLNAIDETGFFENGKKTREFYNGVFQEIFKASQSAEGEDVGISKSLLPDIEPGDLANLFHNLYLAIRKVVTFRDITVQPLKSSGSGKNRQLFTSALRARLERPPSWDSRLSEIILVFFKKVCPWVFILSFAALGYAFFKRDFGLEFFAAVSCLVLFLSMIGVVVIFDYYFAPGLYIRYLSSCYFSSVGFMMFSLLSLRKGHLRGCFFMRRQEKEEIA